jgi:hypothetical protein
MNLRRIPLSMLVAGAVAVGLGLVLVGLRVQEAAITPERPSLLPSPSGPVTLQAEAQVTVPAATGGARTPDSDCPVVKPASASPAACLTLSVTGIPSGAVIQFAIPFARETGSADWRACSPADSGDHMDCPGLDGFRFLSRSPRVTAGPEGPTVSWTAMNRSGERIREAQVVVTYTAPRKPPVG